MPNRFVAGADPSELLVVLPPWMRESIIKA